MTHERLTEPWSEPAEKGERIGEGVTAGLPGPNPFRPSIPDTLLGPEGTVVTRSDPPAPPSEPGGSSE